MSACACAHARECRTVRQRSLEVTVAQRPKFKRREESRDQKVLGKRILNRESYTGKGHEGGRQEEISCIQGGMDS